MAEEKGNKTKITRSEKKAATTKKQKVSTESEVTMELHGHAYIIISFGHFDMYI